LRLLLDTHIALWLLYRGDRLPAAARALIEDARSELLVSAASIWEIAIKHRLDRSRRDDWMPVPGRTALIDLEIAGVTLLPVTGTHAAHVDTLPRHHGDTFDRILVAQALAEPLRLVTADKALAAYGEIVIVV
jgi:PIN domain nuclease of toxin-antitoxin system